jgi:hypothetical protein
LAVVHVRHINKLREKERPCDRGRGVVGEVPVEEGRDSRP